MGLTKKARADIPAGYYNALDYAVTARDMATIDMVKEAVQHNHVMLAYQPVVPAGRPDKPAFYEGLIRVLDETGRVIPARKFIDAIENTETGRVIDCLALQHGLKALSRNPGLRLSINMSARSVGYARWMRILNRGLRKDPTIGERLILEISESSAMLVPELVVDFMGKLQRQGISFALDDFGAGFTSFRYFRDFFFDIVKIHGQFIRGIATDPDNQILTAALASVAAQFDMVTVAETVEKSEDAAYLTEMGINCLQGFYFGAPTVSPPWEAKTRQKKTA